MSGTACGVGRCTALYTFDAGSGVTVVDKTGTHNGTIYGAKIKRVPGKAGCGKALQFPGDTSSITNYVMIPDHRDWRLPRGSIDFWLRLDSPIPTTRSQAIISRDASGFAKGHMTVLLTCSGRLLVLIQTDTGSHVVCSSTAGAGWHYVGINFGTPGLRMWVDGVQANHKGKENLVPHATGAPSAGRQAPAAWARPRSRGSSARARTCPCPASPRRCPGSSRAPSTACASARSSAPSDYFGLLAAGRYNGSIMTPLLQKNLVALNGVDPALCERVCWATEGTNTRARDGALLYRIHRNWHVLEPEPAEATRLVEAMAADRPPLQVGVGGGRLLQALLRAREPDSVVAWERDPWLLMLCLQQTDLAEALGSGRLRLRLGADLLDLGPPSREHAVLSHPVLGPVYHRELAFFDGAPHRRVALLRSGALFVDDMARALERAGFGIYTADTEGLCAEELRLLGRRTGAEVVAAINYQHYLAEFCQGEGLTLICWEIDPSLEVPQPPDGPTDRAHLFSYRRANAELYSAAGFANVEYLPLAADVQRRRPEALGDEVRARYTEPVTFVGASMVQDAREQLAEFARRYVAYAGGGDAALTDCQRRLTLINDAQREDFSRYVVGALLRDQFPGFVAHMAAAEPHLDLEMMVAQAAAAEKRIAYVSALAPLGIKVWGDSGWELAAASGARYAGRMAHHHQELSRIYQCSAINLDVGRAYQSDMVTMRVFDTLACGGFLLTEHSDELAELLEPGVEVATYRDVGDLQQKAAYYLENPDEARAVARRGREAVVQRHNMNDRMEHIFRSAGIVVI